MGQQYQILFCNRKVEGDYKQQRSISKCDNGKLIDNLNIVTICIVLGLLVSRSSLSKSPFWCLSESVPCCSPLLGTSWHRWGLWVPWISPSSGPSSICRDSSLRRIPGPLFSSFSPVYGEKCAYECSHNKTSIANFQTKHDHFVCFELL